MEFAVTDILLSVFFAVLAFDIRRIVIAAAITQRTFLIVWAVILDSPDVIACLLFHSSSPSSGDRFMSTKSKVIVT